MPIDEEILEMLAVARDVPEPTSWKPPELGDESLGAIKVADEHVDARREYLREKYVYGLVAPLRGTRETYSSKVFKEVKDPSERRWLVEEVARVARMQEQAQQKAYGESGYLGRVGSVAQRVGGAFAEGGTGMVEAFQGLRKQIGGRIKSTEDVQFLNALEAAKRAENPFEAPGLAGAAATGAAGMAPDMAAGMAAVMGGGPTAGMAYWTARQQAERTEGYQEMGLSPGTAAAAALPTAAAEGAIELLNIDPTGLMKKIVPGPVKKAIAGKISKFASEKLGGATIKRGMNELTQKYGSEAVQAALKDPVIRRTINAAGGATKRVILEGSEEALQGIVQEGGKYLAAKVSDDPKVEDRPAGDILGVGAEQMKEAMPGLAVLGGSGGIVTTAQTAAQAKARVKRFVEGTKRSKIQNEIIGMADRGHTPSRDKWSEWGLPKGEGMNRAARRDAVQKLAKGYREIDQIRFALSGVTPTEAQWGELGLPDSKEFATEAGRKEYLAKKFLPEVPQGPIDGIPQGPIDAVSQQVQADTAAEAPLTTEEKQARVSALESGPATPAPSVSALTGAAESPVAADPAAEEQAAMGQSPAKHDFPVEMEGTGEQIGGREVVRRLGKIWGTPLRFGRMGMREGVRGIYKIKSQVARLAKGEESSSAVQIHEAIGHHLDQTTDVLKSASDDARKEVGTLDYDTGPKGNRPDEGFAEFIRAYLTGGTERFKGGVDLKVAAPGFLEHFENWLEKNPKIKAKIEASREPLMAFKRAGAVGRVAGQISETGLDEDRIKSLKERVVEWVKFIYWRGKEEGLPVMEFTKKARELGYEKGKGVDAFEMYNAMRNTGAHFASNSIEHGVFTITGTPRKIGPSMYEALAEIEPGEDYMKFRTWAYAQHAIESWGLKKNPGITLEDAKFVMNSLGNKRYAAAAAKVTEYNNALIHVLVDVGAIEGSEAEKIVSYYETYLPLERARRGAGMGGGGGRMVDLSAAIKGRVGSGLQILDPMETSMARAVKIYERASKQLVINKLIEVSGAVEGLGGWVEEVSDKVIADTFSFENIKAQVGGLLEDAGVDAEILNEIDPMSLLTVWRPDMMKVHGVPIYKITVDGKPKFVQLHPDLGDSLGGLDTVQHLDPAAHVARAVTGLMKRGATRLNLDFILSNAIRDFETFLLQGEKGLKGAFDPAKYAVAYMMSEIQSSRGLPGAPEVSLFKMMGGELSTYAGLDRARRKKTLARALRGRQGKLATAANIVGVTEVAPRISEFAAILEKEGWLDRVRMGETPPMTVLIKAINAAHDVTIDFRRMGKWGRYLNYYIPFFNARIEGMDKFIRTYKDHKARSTYRAAQQIVLPALIYWWLRHDDDDYKERPEWQDNFFIFKDEQGNPVWRVSKPHEWGLIGSGVERMMDAMYDKDPEAISRWFGQAMKNINPGAYPSGITPLFESITNYDFSFRDREIESKSLQKLESRDRYYDYTSGVAKKAAEMLHSVSGGSIDFSPAKIDHLANGLSGGLYGKINAPLDKLYRNEDWSISDVPGLKSVTLRQEYPKSINDFYSRKEYLSKKSESKKFRKEESASESVIELHRLEYAESLMTDMRKALRSVSGDEANLGRRSIIGLARAALKKEPLERYKSPVEYPSSAPGAVQGGVRKHIAQKAITASGDPMSERTENAVGYLRDMNVDPSIASDLMYIRLRESGVSSESASKHEISLRKSL